jgi:uncharacterized phage-associated protein
MNIKDRKLVQVLAYLANKNSTHQINKLKAIKLVWAADRFHLRKYGHLVSGDEYFALKYGPVASQLKDIAEHDNYLPKSYIAYAKRFIKPTSVEKTAIEAIQEADDNLLSQTDKEALDFAWEKFGSQTGFKLANLSHSYPEWVKFKSVIESGEVSRAKISLIDFFKSPKGITDDPFEQDKDILANAKEVFIQNFDVERALTI